MNKKEGASCITTHLPFLFVAGYGLHGVYAGCVNQEVNHKCDRKRDLLQI